MHLLRPHRDTIEKIALFVRSLRLWTLELVALWVELFGGRAGRIDLRRRLRELRGDVRRAFFIAVVARMRLLRGATGTVRPRSAPPGARYRRRRTRFIRMVTRGVRLKSLADIRAALDDFETQAARAFARMPKRFLFGVLVAMNVDLFLRAPLCAVSATADAHDTS